MGKGTVQLVTPLYSLGPWKPYLQKVRVGSCHWSWTSYIDGMLLIFWRFLKFMFLIFLWWTMVEELSRSGVTHCKNIVFSLTTIFWGLSNKTWLLHCIFKNIYLYFMHYEWFLTGICSVTVEVTWVCPLPKKWSSWLWAPIWVLGTQLWSSVRATSIPNLWAMSLSPLFLVEVKWLYDNNKNWTMGQF